MFAICYCRQTVILMSHTDDNRKYYSETIEIVI